MVYHEQAYEDLLSHDPPSAGSRAEYNKALCNRGSLTLWLSEEAIEVWCDDDLSGDPGAWNTYSELA